MNHILIDSLSTCVSSLQVSYGELLLTNEQKFGVYLISYIFKIVFTDQQWKFPLALIGYQLHPIDLNAFCIQLAI